MDISQLIAVDSSVGKDQSPRHLYGSISCDEVGNNDGCRFEEWYDAHHVHSLETEFCLTLCFCLPAVRNHLLTIAAAALSLELKLTGKITILK